MNAKAKPIKRLAWLKVFPLEKASAAFDAIVDGWGELAAVPSENFNRSTIERDLTDVLAAHLVDVTSKKLKLQGQWGSENSKAKFHPLTKKIIKRIRTDVTYYWNDETRKLNLVFEFKRLTHHSKSRSAYYGENGMLRFVTGIYSEKQPMACMVGILLEKREHCVPPLCIALQRPALAGRLQMCKHSGKYLINPSIVFPGKADFDTEHVRAPAKAPDHGTIRIAHCFLEFG